VYLRTAARVGRRRRSATSVPEEWPPPSAEPARVSRWYRTRLTRRLVFSLPPTKTLLMSARKRPLWAIVAAPAVDALADQWGITADSRGKGCSSRCLQLRQTPRRVGSICVVDIGCAGRDAAVGARSAGGSGPANHTRGEETGGPGGSPVSFCREVRNTMQSLGFA